MNESAPSDGKRDPDPFRVLGRVIAKHRILRLIGEGGMGAVYEGEHVDLAERRALKFCRVHANPSIKQRAVNEARIGASVRHPSICLVYDFEWGPPDGTTPVVVMELLQGRSLIDDIIKSRRLPWQDVFRILSSVCEGLEVAHAQGVVHRDIKPDNIFLTATGPKIVDFGIAKLATARVTRTGMTLFTPLYASPEQIMNSKEVDARSDIYSCGVILYHSIAGERMFSDGNENALILSILQTAPTPFRVVAPFVPEHVAAVVDRCVAKEPGRRYQSAQALKAALDASLRADDGPLRAGAEQRTLTPAPSEQPTAQLRPAREAAAPREPMPTAAGKVLPPARDPAAPRELMAASAGKAAPLAASASPPFLRAVSSVQHESAPVVAAPVVATAVEPRRPSTGPARTRLRTIAVVSSTIAVAAVVATWLHARQPHVDSPSALAPATSATPATRTTMPAAIPTPAPSGHVRVLSTPAGATVTVAGQVVGHTPTEVTGARDQLLRVRLVLAGYAPRDESVMPSTEGGEADFSLQPVDGAAIAAPPRKQRHRQPKGLATEPRAAQSTNPTSKPVLDENGPMDPFR